MQDFVLARRAMVDGQLRPQGVTDTAVLSAMAVVPREQHVPASSIDCAYSDRAIAVDGGVIIPPAPLGRLLTAALPIPGERALVVGAAPSYAGTVLREIGLQVTELRASDLAATSVDGGFDLILIEGAVEDVPSALTEALAEGGRVATALLTPGGVTRLAIGRKVGGVVGYTRFADSEIPPLPGFARAHRFTF